MRTFFGKVSRRWLVFLYLFCFCICVSGANIVGTFEQAGIGSPLDPPVTQIVQDLAHECTEHNQKLISTLEQDVNHAQLFELTCKDAEMGRMSKPEPVDYRVYSKYQKVTGYLCRRVLVPFLFLLCLLSR